MSVDKIVLPWPSNVLSPNARPGWREKALHTGKYRDLAWRCALSEGPKKPEHEVCAVYVYMSFISKTDARRDKDNCQAMMKSALDGIADAYGIDDSLFHPESYILPKDKERPRVEIELAFLDEEQAGLMKKFSEIKWAIDKIDEVKRILG